jgi:hypothetical protein
MMLYVSLIQMKLIVRTCTSSMQLDTPQKVDDQCYFANISMHVNFSKIIIRLLCLQLHQVSQKNRWTGSPFMSW